MLSSKKPLSNQKWREREKKKGKKISFHAKALLRGNIFSGGAYHTENYFTLLLK